MSGCDDPANEIISVYMAALREVFDPVSECPPIGGGSTLVRFFGGDAIPMAAWDAHSQGDDCATPFLWVRVLRRYRTSVFPNQDVGIESCSLPRVIALEVGVGRCAVIDMEPDWDAYASEAEVSLDDSWRIELSLCRAAALARGIGYSAGIGEVAPYGPDGGVVAWMGEAYVQF
jgi:hypothetical protein